MTEPRRLHRSLNVALAVGAAGMLVVLTRTLGTASWTPVSTGTLALWLGMMAVAILSRLPVPRFRASLSLAVVFDLGAVLVFGPALACLLTASSRVVTCTTERWNPLGSCVRRTSAAVLGVGTAGMVYLLLGAGGGRPMSSPLDGLAFLAAAAVYIGVTRLLEPAARVIRTGDHAEAGRSLRAGVAADLLLTPFAGLLAVMQVEIGSVAVALFLPPLLFSRWALRAWVLTRRGHLETVRMLMAAVDAGDVFTRGHATRISRMSGRVARHLGLPPREVEDIEYAALLHDFGRTAMARDILGKRGRLNEEERAELRAHPRIGHDMIRSLGLFPGAAEIVLAHHEQPDGRGYPRALSGEAIPVGSRIIMAAAAFDALTSDRPYREGLGTDDAFEELLAHSGTQFFPEVVEALLHLFGTGELFADFTEDELLEYAGETGNSRVLETHVSARGLTAALPAKRGTPAPGDPQILELPGAVERREEQQRYELDEGRHLEVAAASDVGCVRTNNEDAFVLRQCEEGALLVVADGMGGAAAGEVASAVAVERVAESFDGGDGTPEAALEHAFAVANDEIHLRAAENPDESGMGTTCTAAYFSGGLLHWAHVGDSRAYRFRDGAVEQLTRDHTLAVEMERLAGSGAGIAGSNHVLTRCLGADASVQIDVTGEPVALETGDTLLLCSDGLSNLVTPEEMRGELAGQCPEDACARLVDLARERGAGDNVTVVVARVENGV